MLIFFASFSAGLASAAAVRHVQGRKQANNTRQDLRPGAVSPTGGRVDAARLAEAESEFQKGVTLLAEDRSAEAMEAFRRAAQLDPSDPRPHHGLGKIHAQLFLNDQAEAAYRKALEVDPSFRPSLESLAMLLYEKGKHEDALAILQQLERDTPQDPFVWGELAINALALGKKAEATALLEKYRAAKPEDAWGHVHLGKAYADSGKLAEAEAEYRRSIELDRNLQIAQHWLSQLLVSTGRQVEAAQHAQIYRRMRQLSTDEQQIRMALQRNPDDLNGLVKLARVQFLLGKRKDCRSAVTRAKAIAPQDPRVVELEGMLEKGVPPPRDPSR